MMLIGVTGGLSTGKSTVAKMLEDRGAKVINADQLAHDVIKKGEPAFKRIVRLFGGEIINLKGEIDRRKLAGIVFSDKSKLKKLENIIHPEVKKLFLSKVKHYERRNKNTIIIYDVPLLFEKGLYKLMDLNIVVKTAKETSVKRAQKKFGLSRQQILKRINTQMPLREKIKRADIVIDNNGTKQKTKKQVNELWQELHQQKTKK